MSIPQAPLPLPRSPHLTGPFRFFIFYGLCWICIDCKSREIIHLVASGWICESLKIDKNHFYDQKKIRINPLKIKKSGGPWSIVINCEHSPRDAESNRSLLTSKRPDFPITEQAESLDKLFMLGGVAITEIVDWPGQYYWLECLFILNEIIAVSWQIASV